jgi:hypothetical protein
MFESEPTITPDVKTTERLKTPSEIDLNDPKVRSFGRVKPVHVKLDYIADPIDLLKTLEDFMKQVNPMIFEE